LFHFQIEEGMEAVQQAKQNEETGSSQRLLARVFLHEGIGYFLRSFEKHMNQQRLNDMEAALASLQT